MGVIIILHRNYKNSNLLHLEDKLDEENHQKIKITLSEEVTFLNKDTLHAELNGIQPESMVTIDMSKSYSIDYDVLEIIDNFDKTAAEKKISISLVGRGERETIDY